MSITHALARVGRDHSIWLAALLLYGIAGLVSPAMLSMDQALNILQVTAFLGLVAAGQTLTLLVGGIDLSVGGMVTMTNILATSIMLGANENIAAAIVACIAVALCVGAVNGLLVACLRVAPIIATLATNSLLFGAALVFTGGAPRGSAAPAFNAIGQGAVFGLPTTAVIWLGIAIFAAVLLRKTVFGRWIYATGANPLAARAMGVPTGFVIVAAYTLCSLLAMLGGLLITSYIGNPSLGIGNQFMLTSVVAVVVGGTALMGGIGRMSSTIAGAIFVTLLGSLTNVANISTGAQFVIQGVLIAASVLVYRALGRQR